MNLELSKWDERSFQLGPRESAWQCAWCAWINRHMQEGEKPKLGMNGTEESECAPNPEHSTDEGAERGKAEPT